MSINQSRIGCPCCGYKTISQSYDICAICRWEYDPYQSEFPLENTGANYISLKDAQKNYLKFGACTWGERHDAKKPSFLDRKDPEWRLAEDDTANGETMEIVMPNHDIVKIFLAPEGGCWCPICGHHLIDFPWEIPKGSELASGSMKPCAGCKTTFGYEDAVTTDSHLGAAMENWYDLRIRWFDKLDWPDWAMKQVRDNLGIDVSELKPKQ